MLNTFEYDRGQMTQSIEKHLGGKISLSLSPSLFLPPSLTQSQFQKMHTHTHTYRTFIHTHGWSNSPSELKLNSGSVGRCVVVQRIKPRREFALEEGKISLELWRLRKSKDKSSTVKRSKKRIYLWSIRCDVVPIHSPSLSVAAVSLLNPFDDCVRI